MATLNIPAGLKTRKVFSLAAKIISSQLYQNKVFALPQDKPLEPIYLSHKPCPIKVVDTALSETMKADEIVKETAKIGKVTAVVTVMSIFKRKR
jgi:hypothetical protein